MNLYIFIQADGTRKSAPAASPETLGVMLNDTVQLQQISYLRTNNHLMTMRTLNIEISDLEYEKFGIKNDQLSFTDFIDMISREISRQNLKKSIELAERYGLSNMTMDEISAEVKAVRNHAAHS